MPVLSLEMKCNMVGVTDFAPADPENHRWHLKISIRDYEIATILTGYNYITESYMAEYYNPRIFECTSRLRNAKAPDKFRCMNCGESRDYWQYVVANEVLEVPGSRGEANLVEKCKLCNRMNTVAIVKDSTGKYNAAEHNEEWQSMIHLDCRGLEPIDFDPRMGWTAIGTESGTVFDDIDLSEKAWADYDEKAAEATEISDVEVRFVHAKQK